MPCALKGWWDSSGQCDVPKLNKGLTYTHVAAGGAHTVLRKSVGTVAVCGLKHPVLRKSDGAVFAVLRPRSCGVCGIAPALEDGLTYTHAAAGFLYTVLLRSDGRVVAFGLNDEGQCDMPVLEGPRHRRGVRGVSWDTREQSWRIFSCLRQGQIQGSPGAAPRARTRRLLLSHRRSSHASGPLGRRIEVSDVATKRVKGVPTWVERRHADPAAWVFCGASACGLCRLGFRWSSRCGPEIVSAVPKSIFSSAA